MHHQYLVNQYLVSRRASDIEWTTSNNLVIWLSTEFQEPTESSPFFDGPFLPRCMQRTRGLGMRILSVRLSVKCMHYDKMEERSVQIFIPYKRSFSLVFWEEECLVGATPSKKLLKYTELQQKQLKKIEINILNSTSTTKIHYIF